MADCGEGISESSTGSALVYDDDKHVMEPSRRLSETELSGGNHNSCSSHHKEQQLTNCAVHLEDNSWTQDQGAAVPAIVVRSRASDVRSSYQVEVKDSTEVHVGPTYHSHYHQENTASRGRSIALKDLEEESAIYQDYCLKKLRDSFVETRPAIRARELIEQHHSVLLIGSFGDGKSSVLHHLSANPLPGYLPIQCNSPKEIRKYIDLVRGTEIKLLFVMDEAFGGSYMQQKLVDDWINKGKHLEMYLTVHKFVFATRTSVWADCKVHLEENPLFCKTVEITSANLTTEDKERMAAKYLGNSGESTYLRECLAYIKEHVAYGQCCKLMGDAVQEGLPESEYSQIFLSPFAYIRSELQKMADKEKVKYATLCLIMVSGGSIKCEDLTSGMSSDIEERIAAVLKSCRCPEKTRWCLRECADKLIGTHLEKRETKVGLESCEIYTFSHISIHETVTMEYGDRNVRDCLKYLSAQDLVSIARPHRYERGKREFTINVPMEYYGELVKIFTAYAIAEEHSIDFVFSNPCVKNERFQSAWGEYLKSSPHKLSTFCQRKDWVYNGCVLYHAAANGAGKLLEFLMTDSHVTCMCDGPNFFGFFGKRFRFWSCPLFGAVDGDQSEIVSYLMLRKPGPTQAVVQEAIVQACRSGRMNVLKTLLPEVCENRDNVIELSLATACAQGQLDIVTYLLQTCYNPCRGDECACGRGLLLASYHGFRELIRLLVAHGADVNTTGRGGDTILHAAASGGCIWALGPNFSLDHINIGNDYQVTPLHLSVNRAFQREVSFLLANGSDINMIDRWGQTPLHVLMRHFESWESDYIKDSESESETDFGEYVAYHQAYLPKLYRRVEMAHKLLEYGADVNISDKWDRTVLDYLAEHKSIETLSKVFGEHGHEVITTVQKEWMEPGGRDKKEMDMAGYIRIFTTYITMNLRY